MSLPRGMSEMGIILRFATASGIPMIVIAMAIAVTTCPIASHRPAMTNQMTLPISEATPAVGLSTTVLPNGHSA